MKRYIKLFFLSLKMSLMREMEYRADFFMVIFQAIIFITFNLIFYKVVIGNVGAIGNWTYADMVILFGTYTIIDGLVMVFVSLGANAVEKYVRTGMMDSILIKPIDSQFMISVQGGMRLSELPSVILGFIVVFFGVKLSGIGINLFNFLGFLFFIFVSLLLFYSLSFLFGCLIFAFDKAENLNEIIYSFKQFAKFPDIYSGLIRYVFMFMVPVVFASFVPAGIIVNKVSLNFSIYYLLISIIMFMASRIVWQISLRKYKSAGG